MTNKTLSFTEKFNKAITDQNGQPANFTKLSKQLDACTDYIGVRKVFFNYKKIQDGLEDGLYVFTKEDADLFWDQYRELKDKFFDAHIESQAKAVDEIEELITKCDTVQELKMIKRGIFREALLDSREITAPLYEQCDSRIKSLSNNAA